MKGLRRSRLPNPAALLLGVFAMLAGAADLVVVAGAPGDEDFGREIRQTVGHWEEAARRAGVEAKVIGTKEGDDGSDLAELGKTVPALARADGAVLWIVLIGHGTFDGREARFNLKGKDLAASALAAWIKDAARPVVVVNGSSSSAPFLKAISGPGRVVVTATKSGSETSFCRFGRFFAEHIASAEADLDGDGGTSVTEAFIAASASVDEFYAREGRIVTEEALIDDNGDGFGTPADWFRGTRAVRSAKDGAEPDGLRANRMRLIETEEERSLGPAERKRRDALEEELLALRKRKEAMEEEAYFRELERIARELSEFVLPVEGEDS